MLVEKKDNVQDLSSILALHLDYCIAESYIKSF